MRLLAAALLVAAACGGTAKTPVSEAPVNDVAAESCCCKSSPMTSEDGQPVYEIGNRMECSTKQGTCVDDVQCQAQPQPE